MVMSIPVSADTAEGTIRQIDLEALTMTLSDGRTYKLPGEINLDGLSVGMAVIVAYEEAGGENRITDMVFLDD
ncbi:hypothetical protein BFN67_09195 [Pseudaminobacter manganicus]|uniref:DUF1344 domain-containing protein n=2 Tax=Manganibacter manganicus TaxID=1873176 RepID=A0A1V8RJU2_9HYPH|nr:hypothetical protein BFN67_09195 [Pseudaminobacter manganicus]